MTPTDPRHGTRAGYLAGCRAPDCTRAHSRYTKQYKTRRELHGPLRVPSDRARAHVTALLASMSIGAVAAAAGVAPSTVRELMTRPTVTRRTESRVLRVRPLTLVGTRHVSSVGTVRRVQALNAMGYSLDALAEATGLSQGWLQRLSSGAGSPWMESATAAAVARVYADLSMKVPVGRDRFERSGITATRRAAARKGFLPPLAWDDIDNDPSPAVTTGRVGAVEEIEWLARAGETLTGAAERLGYANPGSLERTLQRVGRPDLIATLRGRAA